jgi:hypothetical protein
MHGIHYPYLSIFSGGFLGEVGDAVPEFGPTSAVSGYYGGVHNAEDDRYVDRGVTQPLSGEPAVGKPSLINETVLKR